MNRRQFLGAGVAAAALALTGCGQTQEAPATVDALTLDHA